MIPGKKNDAEKLFVWHIRLVGIDLQMSCKSILGAQFYFQRVSVYSALNPWDLAAAVILLATKKFEQSWVSITGIITSCNYWRNSKHIALSLRQYGLQRQQLIETEMKVIQLMGFSLAVPPAAELLSELLVGLKATHQQSLLACAICNDTFTCEAILHVPAPLIAAACAIISFQIDVVFKMPDMTQEQKTLSLKFFFSRVLPFVESENSIFYRSEWGSHKDMKVEEVKPRLIAAIDEITNSLAVSYF